jgi:undecaprenyl diphosphate synthase
MSPNCTGRGEGADHRRPVRSVADIFTLIEETERRTRDNTKFNLVVAFNYGSRQEIARAARHLCEEVKAGRLTPDEITPETMAKALYASDVPDPDLLIRTSGEQRLSNFLAVAVRLYRVRLRARALAGLFARHLRARTQ